MKIILDINSGYKETTVNIQCSKIDYRIQQLIDFLKEEHIEFILGKKGDMQYILKPDEIHFFRTNQVGVEAVTENGIFQIKEKLYELEEKLPKTNFVRLSKSVIANLLELNRFEASFNGTLCVYFKSGEKEYVSRHYVPIIKEALKVKRRKEK